MELDRERIREKFALYSGEDLTEEGPRAALCAQLCLECAGKAEAMLESSRAEKPERYGEAVESWAAAEAFYQLTLADGAVSPESVSADGVQIKEGERSRRAKALAEEKRKAVLPVFGEEAFYFGRA